MDKTETNLKKPICKGYLYKENVGTFHTAFNLRYFALYRRYLVYYENQHDFEKDVSSGSLEVWFARDTCKKKEAISSHLVEITGLDDHIMFIFV